MLSTQAAAEYLHLVLLHSGGPQALTGVPTTARQYYFSNVTMNWYDAQYFCNINYGGSLVWFENEATQIKYDAWVQGSTVGNGAYADYW
jgi:hypothetical protein